MIRTVFVSLCLAGALTGCATSGAATGDPAQETQRTAVSDIGGLPAQQLAAGECGLFMWTLAEPRRLVFFSKAGSERAISEIGETEAAYIQTRAEGDIFGQFTTNMSFASEADAGTLRVSLIPGEMLEEGQRTKAASLIRVDSEGWETITPVRGVRACSVG